MPGSFDVERVPEVANAKAAERLARTELERARQLSAQQLLSASDFDQRAAQAEAAARQYDTARNAALQQYQSLVAARARASLAAKAVADATVRAPFAGVVAERLVSVGDYVTRGTKVATVLRVDPLRVELTVPAPFVAEVAPGRTVTLEVDAFPGETFTGQIRYVSPALNAESRALIVEAEVANQDGRLKPGLFATARIEQANRAEALLVPSAAVRTVAGTPRVFVIGGDGETRAEERVVATGQVVGDRVEVTSGLQAGEVIVSTGLEKVVDGIRVTVAR
jgi:RND family efflux transporter MFP subunit